MIDESMRRVIFNLFFFLGVSFSAIAQNHARFEEVLAVLGVGAEDVLDPYELERLQDLTSRPLKINLDPHSRMISSGLFSNYQIASLNDYRKRCGDVMSLSELASVDGFGKDFVEKISPFISLVSFSSAGNPANDEGVSNDLSMKLSIKSQTDMECGYGFKYKADIRGGVHAAIAFSRPYDERFGLPESFSGYVSWDLKRIPLTLTAGDFNARFGQGLVMWNGMSLSGLSSPASYIRSASGISKSWSFTGSSAFTGLALSSSSGPFFINAAISLPDIKHVTAPGYTFSLLPALNLTWLLPNGQIGLTNYAHFGELELSSPRIPDMKSSIDCRFCVSGVDLFSELAYDWVSSVPAALIGVTFPLAEDIRAASMLRLYPDDYSSTMSAAPRSGSRCADEYALSLAAEAVAGDYVNVMGNDVFSTSVRRHKIICSADAVYFPESRSDKYPITAQLKLFLSWQAMVTEYLRVTIRLQERLRNWENRKSKTDLRTDVSWLSHRFSANARINVLKFVGCGFLTYIEGGYKTEKLSIYLRQGLFFIDDWDDRIYAYEHDAPGSFSVPAYYGDNVLESVSVMAE